MPDPYKSMGIDLSASATGVVVLGSYSTMDEFVIDHAEIKYTVNKKSPNGAHRTKEIVLAVMEMVHEHDPHVIVVEGYGLSFKHKSSVVPLVELGGVMRLMLYLDGLEWLDPRPTEVKEFVTGSGNSKKEAMIAWVSKRWGFDTDSDNVADAYGLAKMGLARTGRMLGATARQIEIVGGLTMRKT